MKGIILIGFNESAIESSSDLYPNQLITLYDKPLIYYPLSILLQAGIKEIMFITKSVSLGQFENLLGDGSQWGIKITYFNYPKPEGILNVLLLAEEFITNEAIAVISSDLIILGHTLKNILKQAVDLTEQGNAVIIGKNKCNKKGFKENIIINDELKDKSEQENFEPVGLNFYPDTIMDMCRNAEKSKQFEFDFQTANKNLYKKNKLKLMIINDHTQFYNTPDFQVISMVTEILRNMNQISGINIGSVDDIALEMGYVK